MIQLNDKQRKFLQKLQMINRSSSTYIMYYPILTDRILRRGHYSISEGNYLNRQSEMYIKWKTDK
jgi:hypothetical protein